MTGKEAEISGRHFQLYQEAALTALDLYIKFTP